MTLQALIDQSPPGGVVTLTPAGGEFEGPLVLKRSMTIDGNGGTIWARRGPVVIVRAPQVVIRNVTIAATSHAPTVAPRERIALKVADVGRDTFLQNVTVQGLVEGVPAEEDAGPWDYPTVLRLPDLPAGEAREYRLRLLVGAPCTVESTVAAVVPSPAKLGVGEVELTLHCEALRAGTVLRGSIILRAKTLLRRIEIAALVVDGVGPHDGTPLFVLGAEPIPVPPTPSKTAEPLVAWRYGHSDLDDPTFRGSRSTP